MAIDSTIELYEPTITRAADGTPIKTWVYASPNDTITADVQPKGLSQAQIALWGLNIQEQDAKAVYDFSFSAYWQIANRARVDGSQLYRIMSVNQWPSHVEALLVPLSGTI